MKVELNKSKQSREQQSSEYQRQKEQSDIQHQQLIAELKIAREQDRQMLLQDFHTQKDSWHTEKDSEQRALRETFRTEVSKMDERMRERADKDAKVSACIIHARIMVD